MSLGVIRNEKELVEAFFNTNLNDSVAVTELTQDIKNNCFVDGKIVTLVCLVKCLLIILEKHRNMQSFLKTIRIH